MNKANENKIFKAIGCMSGTAMDGIDIALIESDGYGYIKPIGFLSETHDPDFREKLRICLNKTEVDSDVKLTEDDFTKRHVPLIQKLINKFNLLKKDIDIIGFHGQTIHHDPENKLTVQMGDGDLLAQETGIDVVHSIRHADVQAGGQGAPFLPVYHRALALNAGLELPVAIINIGGVGNITWINNDGMIAFDTGPGNAMIDDWVKMHTGKAYDDNGAIAAKGIVDQTYVTNFLNSPYFLKKYPKSLDRNDFIDIKLENITFENGAATLTEMTIRSIALGVSQCPKKPKAIYVTGGGRHNAYIMKRLAQETNLPVYTTDTLGWNGDAMEAQGFAYMAVRTLLNEPISFPSTTGCPKPTVGGIIAKSNHDKVAA
jgi:anhydro-N-acetylmuramic acid kinase